MKKMILLIFIIISVVACSQNNSLPENVQKVFEKAGDNRNELEKVIHHYQNPKDTLKLKAAFFLIGNMEEQSYLHFIVADSNNTDMHFNVLDYSDYKTMVAAWDSLEAIHGEISNWRDTTIFDFNSITADYLITNIDLAFKTWQEYSWAKHINFSQFCEYILPYRGSNELLEKWRPYFYEKYQWIKDSVKNIDDPVEAAILINNDIKSWFTFDSRFYRQKTDQGLSEMFKTKMGRCEDMTNLAIYAMRAMAIPVMTDFTPYWAKTGNNHAWNAIIDRNGKVIIFMGGLFNPGEYKLNQAKAKVYRKTFALQPNSLAVVKPEWEKAPPYINSNNIIDITNDYVPVTDVKLTLEQKVPDSMNYAYICVFNTGEWKAIHWSIIESGNKVNYTDMGLDIAYMPAYYVHEKIIPAGTPFILTKTGKTIFLKADTTDLRSIKLVSTTRRITQKATDNIEYAFFEEGLSYELFYWTGGWKSLGKKTAGNESLIFANAPAHAIFWLVAENSKDQERIFTINASGKQVWW